jgi:hypothetical protein
MEDHFIDFVCPAAKFDGKTFQSGRVGGEAVTRRLTGRRAAICKLTLCKFDWDSAPIVSEDGGLRLRLQTRPCPYEL